MTYDYLEKKKRIISAEFLYKQSSYIINSTVRTKDGMIWYRDESGLAFIDPKTGDSKWYFSDDKNNILGESIKLVCFYQDQDEIIWLGYGNGIIRFDYKLGQYKKIDLGDYINTQVDDIKKDAEGTLWLGTEQDGLLRYSEEFGVIDHFRAEGSMNHRLTSNATAAVYIDDQNLIWVNTDPEGIDVLIPDLKPFKNYSDDFFDLDFFSTKGVRTFLNLESKNVLIGTQEDGLIIFDPKKDKIIQRIFPGENGFEPNSATCFLQDNFNRIWVGTYDGLYLSEKEGDRFQKVVNKSYPDRLRTTNFISHILESRNGGIIFSTEQGIYFISPKTTDPLPIDTLYGIVSNRLHLTPNDYLLVAEPQNGFHILKASDWLVRNSGKYNNQRNVNHFLPEFNIKHFCQSEEEGIIWIATTTGFLKVRFTSNWSEIEILKHYTRDNGLPSNCIYGILPDNNKMLWMSTNRGICRFDPTTEVFSKYTVEDGLQGFEYNTNSFVKTADGEFYFGGTNGFNRFYPAFEKNEKSPLLQITNFKVNDKKFNEENYIGEQQEVFLTAEENTFTFQFSAIDYQSNGNNRYRAILENYDEDWKDLEEKNSIRYTKVPPGDYLFKVTAANNDGVWASVPKTLLVHIATPWYLTTWAYLAYAMSIGFILFQIYQVKKRRRILNQQLILEQKEADRLKELDSFKTKFYANITHEFRTPLTVIEGMAEELNQSPEKEPKTKINLIKKNSKNLLSLVNQMLDLSKLQSGKIKSNLQQDDIIKFIKYIVASYESFSKVKNVGLQFYSEEEELLMDFDHQKLEQILTNLISNAVKFTPEYGKILVVAKNISTKDKNFLQIKIKDSGIGIPASELPFVFDRFHQANTSANNQGTGIGLAIVKELTTILNGSVRVDSETGKGSTFYLEFPISNNAPLILNEYELTKRHLQKEIKNSISNNYNNTLPILLIIEDNADVTYYLQTCLQNDYQIYTSNNGREGIAKAFETLPDIIISDVMMPELDGFETCAILKEDERTSHIPIILLTAKATSEDKLEGLSHGADAYLIKPFEKAELMIRLNKLMEIRRTLQQKYSGSLITSNEAYANVIANKQDEFIRRVEEVILVNLENEDFSIPDLARALHLSRSQVYRKIKALTDMSTAIYIRHVRLQKAKELLRSTPMSISEIAYKTGFKTAVYFSQVFKETFGESPSATRK
ncbi:MAG: ATP-binding protein [Saprospiraceae bacterium]